MTSQVSPPGSALDRLTASRKALVRQMVGGSHDAEGDAPHELSGSDSALSDHGLDASGSTMWQVLTQTLRSWLRHHPAQVAFDIGKPLLSNYAREKPYRLLGVSAAVGAAAVLVKPWRLVSVTGLALALFKSPKLSNALVSLLTSPSAKQKTRKVSQ